MKIRFVRADDERQTKRLIVRYLKETFEQGGDFPPTLENAQAFFDHAVEGAECGDPCLVAEGDEGRILGFVMARGLDFPGMQTRDHTIRSWGSYVLPEHRGERIAIKLFMVMGRVAKNKGYTRILGMTHGTGHADNAMKVAKSIVGMKEVGAVLVWQLSAPLVGGEHATMEQRNVPAAVLAPPPARDVVVS